MSRWAGGIIFEDVPSETLVFEIAIDKSQGAGHILGRSLTRTDSDLKLLLLRVFIFF